MVATPPAIVTGLALKVPPWLIRPLPPRGS